MKFRLLVLFLAFSVIVNVQLTFANTEANTNLTKSDLYQVNFDNKELSSNVKVCNFEGSDDYFVSLREVIEALGGSIEWTPNYNSYSLGYFELLGSKYEYESAFLLDPENENVKYKEEYCPIDIYTNIDGHKTILTMSGSTEALIARFVDNKIYIDVTTFRCLLPRMGYLINFDSNLKVMNVKKYDYSKEKELILKKFPVETFWKGFYGEEYESSTLAYTNEWYCWDMCLDQVGDTEALEESYKENIDNEYKKMFFIGYDNKLAYKNMLKAISFISRNKFDVDVNNLNIQYDKDLDAYIIYDKDYTQISELDDSYKILVIRCFDNMILFCNV